MKQRRLLEDGKAVACLAVHYNVIHLLALLFPEARVIISLLESQIREREREGAQILNKPQWSLYTVTTHILSSILTSISNSFNTFSQ
jgi:hypothetical protein